MTHEEILRERVAKLEVQMVHLKDKLDDTHQKVDEMHAILLQAKGRDGYSLVSPESQDWHRA